MHNRNLQDIDLPKYLAPIYTKEVLYRLLNGHYGAALAQIALEGSSTYRITECFEEIIRNYDKPLRIEVLAKKAHMSISSFHSHFKEVTAMSPIQFQKQLRLQEARRLLLSESADAADAAFRVGYESASQFSREYARMFGSPPKADMNDGKNMLIAERNLPDYPYSIHCMNVSLVRIDKLSCKCRHLSVFYE